MTAYCVTPVSQGGKTVYELTDPQPADVSLCSAVVTASSNVRPSPLDLSIDTAVLIGFAIMAVWAVAWGFRMLRKALDTDEIEAIE